MSLSQALNHFAQNLGRYQIPGTDTGIASDACVATHARSTDVGRLAGRPGPHGRQGLRTADAAYGMNRSGSRGEVFPYGLA